MKKLVLTVVACIAMMQGHAATSSLVESLLEYQAINDALGSNPSFENIIPSTEFIVDIQRTTREVNTLGIVRYEIVTRTSNGNDNTQGHKRCRKRRHSENTNTYLAELNVAVNPGIGPNIVTVISIIPSGN